MKAGGERSGEGGWGTWAGTVRVVVRADWLELGVEGGLARSPTRWAPLTNPRPYQGPAKISLSLPAYPGSSDPREDGKTRKERVGKLKMEEVRPSYLVLMLTCDVSLIKGLWGLSYPPNPHRPRQQPASPGTMVCLNLP